MSARDGSTERCSRLRASQQLLDFRKDSAGSGLQSLGQTVDRRKRRIANTALNTADVRAIEFGFETELLLGEIALEPELPNDRSKGP